MIRPKKYFPLLFLILSINFSLTGCFNTKVSDCKKIINITTELAVITQANLTTKDTKKILEIADIFENSGQQILDKSFQDKQLNKYVKNLAIIYQNYGELTRNFVNAFQTKDTEKAIFYKEKIIKLSQDQKDLVNNINNYCRQN
ncbi:hypothetical protein [Geminocystis sp. NIES-3709]|uniref:hypothetical protein n=1 Tax=Geminocystis sp. NIES-3709 TaxID=1617448 RepID=UPI0005FCD71B|nr:hypothetical protein [Geminocystis sp. NIES-3709]BAQ64364.1 hypothetical protein GM3709_1129 [Geminocystis sp. NIES-3709]